MKPLVSLIRHPVACSARISVDTQTDRQTDRQTNYTVTLAAHARRGLIIIGMAKRKGDKIGMGYLYMKLTPLTPITQSLYNYVTGSEKTTLMAQISEIHFVR